MILIAYLNFVLVIAEITALDKQVAPVAYQRLRKQRYCFRMRGVLGCIYCLSKNAAITTPEMKRLYVTL